MIFCHCQNKKLFLRREILKNQKKYVINYSKKLQTDTDA